jgi:hypothetical protein
VSISGNTDFWHNDLFTQTDQNRTGNNLFGTDRLQNVEIELLTSGVALLRSPLFSEDS